MARTANSALSTANTALTTANAVDGKATTALATAAACRRIAPRAWLAPLLALAGWWLAGATLRPLNRVAREVRARDADSLTPLPDAGLPEELAPLVQSLNALLARLSRYGAGGVQRLEPVDAAEVIEAIAARYRGAGGECPVYAAEGQPCLVMASRETLEQVLAHLVQNAIDASQPGMAVILQARFDGLGGVIEVSDTGCGMSADFVRNRLFKPFVSTKAGGFGMGSFEAPELGRAMNGWPGGASPQGVGRPFTGRWAACRRGG